MEQQANTAPAGLAQRLRDATGTAHSAAERTAFVRHLFKGTLSRAGYTAFIRSLHPVYAALEEGLGTNQGDEVVAMIYDPALDRTASLEKDLAFFGGPGWRDMAVTDAAAEYAEHLGELARTAPRGLVAHAYVRYLGDLSGGQMMGKRVGVSYDAGDAGTNFYAFHAVPDLEARKHAYRAALTALPLTAGEQDRVVNEAIAGFDYARRIFEELDREFSTDLKT